MIAEPVRDRPLDDSHFSLYLDLCRFLAALAVLLGHLHFDGFAAAAIWHQFSHEAVIIFFVISGVVIAHSAEGRSWQAYLAARASRLYTVIIPALMFSILLAAFIGPGWPDGTQKAAEWKLTELPLILAFLSQSWLIGAEVPLNRPFWSLCYEAFYYLMFALYLYGGRRRFLWTGIAALVAGPAILALMPAWLAGVWLHHRIVDHRVPVPRSVAVVTMVMIIAICALRIPDLVSAWVFERYPIWYVLRSSTQVLTDLPIAALFVLHLIAVRQRPFAGLLRWQRPIRILAGSTFTLYLFHRPILLFLGGDRFADIQGPVGTTLLFFAIVGGAVLLSRLLEVRLTRMLRGFMQPSLRANAAVPGG